jgi:plasmid stabilization system protein ParE
MQIIKDDVYLDNLETLLRYIADENGTTRARSVNSQINKIVKNIPNFPYKYRKSHYYDDENIRDCIFKGYTLPYLIDNEKNQIIILDIFKWSKR